MARNLTGRQLEVTLYIANGYRIKEIAEETFTSESSVSKTLSSAQKVMGAKTPAQLVGIVIHLGLFEWKESLNEHVMP